MLRISTVFGFMVSKAREAFILRNNGSFRSMSTRMVNARIWFSYTCPFARAFCQSGFSIHFSCLRGVDQVTCHKNIPLVVGCAGLQSMKQLSPKGFVKSCGCSLIL